MRSFRWLAAGAALIAVLVGFVALALYPGTYSGRASAIVPTPSPLERTYRWNVQVPQHLVAGSVVQIVAKASIIDPEVLESGVVVDHVGYGLGSSDPVNSGNGSVLELMSPSRVPVEDVTDGAEWDLRLLRRGRAWIKVSVGFRVRLCSSCDAFHESKILTYRSVTVKPLPGDVDCNVAANSIDAALVLQLDAELIGELPCQDVADVSRDGSVDALDATLILQYAAGLVDSLSL